MKDLLNKSAQTALNDPKRPPDVATLYAIIDRLLDRIEELEDILRNK